ncbi:unnamed protein product [Effrenium voratum]|nr:unnamed protein product [Effrenium voratum]
MEDLDEKNRSLPDPKRTKAQRHDQFPSPRRAAISRANSPSGKFQAYIIPAGMGLILKKGTWHDFPVLRATGVRVHPEHGRGGQSVARTELFQQFQWLPPWRLCRRLDLPGVANARQQYPFDHEGLYDAVPGSTSICADAWLEPRFPAVKGCCLVPHPVAQPLMGKEGYGGARDRSLRFGGTAGTVGSWFCVERVRGAGSERGEVVRVHERSQVLRQQVSTQVKLKYIPKPSYCSLLMRLSDLFVLGSGAGNLHEEVLSFSNAFREREGLPPLQMHKDLCASAVKHAEAMADGLEAFSHDGAPERFQRTGLVCQALAENLSVSEGYPYEVMAEATVDKWIASEGHRRNLLGPFNVCGIGWSSNDRCIYVTQLLAFVDLEKDEDRLSEVLDVAWRRTMQSLDTTPVLCCIAGLVFAGSTGAVAGGLLGKAAEAQWGVRPSSVPAAVLARAKREVWPTRCTNCGAAGEILLSQTDRSPLCSRCHPAPEDTEVWCFVD